MLLIYGVWSIACTTLIERGLKEDLRKDVNIFRRKLRCDIEQESSLIR